MSPGRITADDAEGTEKHSMTLSRDHLRPLGDSTIEGQRNAQTPEHRPRRLRLHGPDALERATSASMTSSTSSTAPSSRPSAAGREDGAKAFAEKWGYESVETDWRKLVERKDIDAIDICTPNNTHAEIAIAAAEAGQDGPLREAAGDEPGRGPEDGRGRREGRRAQHRLVQLPPRPGRHPGQAAHRRGPARQDLPLPGQLPPGLDDLGRPAAGRRGPLAARRRRGRLGRHRRPARPLHRHGALAQRLDHDGLRHDRDVRQGAEAQPHRQGRAGGHRRRLRLPLPLRQRLARPLRVDPLRPRPQGPLHLRDQRREGLAQVGPPRPAPARVLRPRRRGHRSAAGGRSTSPTATTPT